MRYLYIFSLLVCLVSCKSNKKLASAKHESSGAQLCPENGDCNLVVLKNKALQVKTDNFGEVYTELKEGKKIVLKFEYKKKEIPDVQDGSYREEVFIELSPNNLELETSNLQEQKLFFARWCFCKGQTGYYNIKNGHLSIKKKTDKTYQLNLDFQITEVPQIIKKIDQTFTLE